MKLLQRGLAALCALAALGLASQAAAACTPRSGNTSGVDSSAMVGYLADICDAVAPSSASSAAIAPVVTSAAASSLVAKASAGNLYGFSGYSTVSGWFLVFDATSAPADGAVTPIDFYPYTAAQAFAVDYSGAPIRGSTGLTIVFSTTGPYTKTASATASISAKVQ